MQSVHGKPKRKLGHRTLLNTGGVGIVGAGAFLYQAAPSFLRQYNLERKRVVAPPPLIPDPSRWPDTGLHAAWLGHSTVLLKVEGLTVLTDPVFSTRAGVHLGLMTIGVKRLVAPALELRNLPPIDLIVLSHAHMDHFDIPSLRKLENRRTQVVTAAKTSDLLRVGHYGQVLELGWGEERQVGRASVKGLEVNHWGARLRTDTYRGYNGYLLRIGRYRILFAGDTADTQKLKRVAGAGGIDLAIMPIGAYDPWERFHCTPEQAWRMSEEAQAHRLLPVHHSTFQLSKEPGNEPMERLQQAAGSESHRIVLHEIGQEYTDS